MIDLKEFAGEGFLFALFFDHQLRSLFFHVGFRDFRNQLYEQHHADYAENVGDAVANGNQCLIFLGDRCLSRGERGSGGQRAGEQTDDHSHKSILLLNGSAVADYLAQTNASCSGKTAGQDDDQAKENVRFKIALEVTEELGAGNETDRGNKEDQTKAFHQRKAAGEIVGGGGAGKDQSRVTRAEEQCTKEKCDNKHPRISQGDSLDGDSAQGISDRQNGEHDKQQGGDIANGDNSVK